MRPRRLHPHVLGIGSGVALAGAIGAASVRGSPLRVGGLEHGDASSVVFVSALAAAFAVYVLALAALRHGTGRTAAVLTIAVVIQLIPLAGPLLLSRDVYSYWAYGRVAARHDRDPYAVPPARFPTDPATHATAPIWRTATSVYGPGFTAASEVVGDVAGSSAETAALFFRISAAVAAIGATFLAARIARRKAFAAAFVGWNPLLAVSFAGGGHNDAWMVLLMLGALALALRRRDVAAGAVWLGAAAVKAPALLLLPLELVRSRRGFWIGAIAAAVVGTAGATAAFGTAWLTSLLQLGSHEARFAMPVRLEQIGVPEHIAHSIAALVLVCGGVWLMREARRGRRRLALGSCLLLLTSPWILPWYATWPIALAAVEEDPAAQVLALAVAAYMLPSRIPF